MSQENQINLENSKNINDNNNNNPLNIQNIKEKEVNKGNQKESNNNKYNAEILNVPNEFSEYEINFKIIIIGDSGVGKTCITNQAVKNEFWDKYQATIGMEIYSLFIKIDNKIIKFQIWDTCGQEMYKSLITNFYRSSSLAILVYSIDQKDSFNDLDLWIKELKTNNSPDTKLILVGNKSDLENKRQVKYNEGKKFAEDFQFIDFFETSAKTGENIPNMFIRAANVLYEEHIKYKDYESDTSFTTFRPAYGQGLKKGTPKKTKTKTSKCC